MSNSDFRTGSTPVGYTDWRYYEPGTIYVDVDTSEAGFTDTPFYITSLSGYHSHYKTIGATSIYYPKSNGFRIFIRDPNRPNLSPADANEMGWHVIWIGIEKIGSSIAGSAPDEDTKWKNYDNEHGTIYIDVKSKKAGFTTTPYYFTSLGGSSSHYKTLGVSSIYQATPGGFRVYIRDPNRPNLSKDFAEEKGWHVIWLGLEKIGSFNSGSTLIRNTAWQHYEPGTIYVDVEIGCTVFTTTPYYIASLGGYHSHYKTLGATSIYYPKSNGFRIYIRDSNKPNLTPADANEMGWHIRWLGIEVTKWYISPWLDNGRRPEIDENIPPIIPGFSPIKYQEIWDREREMLDYNPRFLPNTVTFDQKNRPVIRVGVHDIVGKHATVYYSQVGIKEVYIQTLDATGKWIALSLSRVMKDKIPDWNDDLIYSGVSQAEERVVFDASGDAYTIVKTKNHGDFLLHSKVDMENWDVYALPVEGIYRIEMTASDRPPVIFVLLNSVLSIIAPEKKDDGTLNNLSLIDLVTEEKWLFDGPSHSGVGDLTVTVDYKTHVVYGSRNPVEGMLGTPQYIVTYNHDDQTVTEPVLLGTTGKEATRKRDRHNGPAIVADSQGFLHVVLGSHQTPFKYRVSTIPNDSTAWIPAVEFSNPGGKETYVSLVVDQSDTLHLASRMVDDDGYCLHYMRKKRNDETWHEIGKLVIPQPNRYHYGIWYHKLMIDRRGRLFLAYFYYAADKKDMTDESLESYRRKWPNEEVAKASTNAHDPVILMSKDRGSSWNLATTKDFKEGMKGIWLEPFLGIMMESISKESWLQPFLNMTMK